MPRFINKTGASAIYRFLKSKNKKLNPMRTIMKKYITNTNKYKL